MQCHVRCCQARWCAVTWCNTKLWSWWTTSALWFLINDQWSVSRCHTNDTRLQGKNYTLPARIILRPLTNKNWQQNSRVTFLDLPQFVDPPKNRRPHQGPRGWSAGIEWKMCTTFEDSNPPRLPSIDEQQLWYTHVILMHSIDANDHWKQLWYTHVMLIGHVMQHSSPTPWLCRWRTLARYVHRRWRIAPRAFPCSEKGPPCPLISWLVGSPTKPMFYPWVGHPIRIINTSNCQPLSIIATSSIDHGVIPLARNH